jgi:hypothetical protein|tara:strand:- start:1694 stop:2107 length:414 start_codon:yes stop_codon:yes gene_type:complete
MVDNFVMEGPDTKYNAGYALALYINMLVMEAGNLAFSGDYAAWYRKLQIIERRLYPFLLKRKDNDKILVELKNIHIKYNYNFRVYLFRNDKKKKITSTMLDLVKDYMDEYERFLLVYREKVGLGMPEGDDIAKAAWR